MHLSQAAALACEAIARVSSDLNDMDITNLICHYTKDGGPHLSESTGQEGSPVQAAAGTPSAVGSPPQHLLGSSPPNHTSNISNSNTDPHSQLPPFPRPPTAHNTPSPQQQQNLQAEEGLLRDLQIIQFMIAQLRVHDRAPASKQEGSGQGEAGESRGSRRQSEQESGREQSLKSKEAPSSTAQQPQQQSQHQAAKLQQGEGVVHVKAAC